jgi:hypothetical protein
LENRIVDLYAHEKLSAIGNTDTLIATGINIIDAPLIFSPFAPSHHSCEASPLEIHIGSRRLIRILDPGFRAQRRIRNVLLYSYHSGSQFIHPINRFPGPFWQYHPKCALLGGATIGDRGCSTLVEGYI